MAPSATPESYGSEMESPLGLVLRPARASHPGPPKIVDAHFPPAPRVWPPRSGRRTASGTDRDPHRALRHPRGRIVLRAPRVDSDASGHRSTLVVFLAVLVSR